MVHRRHSAPGLVDTSITCNGCVYTNGNIITILAVSRVPVFAIAQEKAHPEVLNQIVGVDFCAGIRLRIVHDCRVCRQRLIKRNC